MMVMHTTPMTRRYAVLQLASAAASFVFASWLAGHYAAAAVGQGTLSFIPVSAAIMPGTSSNFNALSREEGLAIAAPAAAYISFGGNGHLGGNGCRGYQCYAPTFRVVVALNVVSLCGVFWLVRNTWTHYDAIVAGRRQEQQLQHQGQQREQLWEDEQEQDEQQLQQEQQQEARLV